MFDRVALFMLRHKWLVRLSTRVHILVYRLTGGAVMGLVSGLPNLLLTTTGRKSGKRRTTPLFYLPDGDRFVVVASYGGNPKSPAWWLNFQSDPRGWVEVGGAKFTVEATQASPELKQRLWPVFARHYPAYDDYQARTDRDIPLVVLSPV